MLDLFGDQEGGRGSDPEQRGVIFFHASLAYNFNKCYKKAVLIKKKKNLGICISKIWWGVMS